MTKLLNFVTWIWRIFYWWNFYASHFIFAFFNFFFEQKKVSEIGDEILLESAVSLARKIRDKEITCEHVVECCIKRCREVNELINAVVEENFQRALEEARAIDKSLENGSAPSSAEAPFLGVPFSVKDHMFVKGMLCTAGIPKRRNLRVFEDADVVTSMKKSGAIVLCMTNVSELCMWYESYNTIYGRTCNPYDNRRTSGGSSGGQGALIAAGGVPFGVGSDIGGSIRIPCYFNGIFGHKPTKDLISINGVCPAARDKQKAMYCMGPMCRYAEDLMPMFKVLGGPELSTKLNLDSEVDLTKLRIFYMNSIDTLTASPVNHQLKNSIEKVVKHFHTKYDVLSYKLDLEFIHWALAIWLIDMDVPGAPKFSQEMCNLQGDFVPAVELLKWLVGQSSHTYPALSLALTEKLLKKLGSEEDRRQVGIMRKMLTRQFDQLLGGREEASGVEAVFLFPPHPQLAPYHGLPCFWPFDFQYTAIFNSLGMPVTCCPLGLTQDGLPLGVQIAGAVGKDRVTLAVALELERAFGGWSPPTPSSSSSEKGKTRRVDISSSKIKGERLFDDQAD